jgi:hypothetical protein
MTGTTTEPDAPRKSRPVILSHKHKFIYLKTMKTASSSMEIGLSRILGPDDVITPTRDDLDSQRSQGMGGQNYRLDHPDVPRQPLLRRLLGRPERTNHPSIGFHEHIGAEQVRRYVGQDVWSSYYKFTFERNPWDRQISYYFYKTRHKARRPDFERFLRRKSKVYIPNFEIYAIDGEIAVDFVGRYENLSEDFNKAIKAIGMKEEILLPMSNVAPGKDDRNYRQYYNEHTRDTIAEWYAREISAFGYKF